jgi:hypothetical protein
LLPARVLATILLLALFAHGEGFGACPDFQVTTPGFATGTLPRSVVVGDFNGDGKPDLAVANEFSDDVSILLGHGDGTFSPAVNYALGKPPSYPQLVFPDPVRPLSLAVGDFNGDGKSDLAVADFGAGTISILLGRGDGTFSSGPAAFALAEASAARIGSGVNAIRTVYSGYYQVVVGDLDGDGKLDLVVTNFFARSTVTILLGHGDGTFGYAITYDAGGSVAGGGVKSVAIGDFNGDGKNDLAVTSLNPYGEDNNPNTVSILLGKGDGTFGKPVTYEAAPYATSVVVGDFNGDGKSDLAVATADSVAILLGNGNGTFAAPTKYPAGAGILFLAVGDFNGNGKSDLAVVSALGVSLLLGNGNGTFAASAVHYLAGGGRQYEYDYPDVHTAGSPMAIGDFNGDGKTDLAVADNHFSNSVSILLGNGNGTFDATVTYPVGSAPTSVAAGDFNGDGRSDLAVTNSYSNNVSILLGDGNGTFAPAVFYGVGSSPNSVTIGDFDGDGKRDLAVANSGSNTVSILLGIGNGTFGIAPSIAVGTNPRSIAVGDFNGDGNSDLAVANGGNDQAVPSISILLGDGKGLFAPAINYPSKESPISLVVGDFNGDGKSDLAVASVGYRGGSVSILLGDGKGGFGAAIRYPFTGSPVSLAIGDFNGDGKSDLAVRTYDPYDPTGGYGVWVLSGNGDGTFAPAVGFAPNSYNGSMAIGDFNGDGKSDLAVTNPFSVTILLGSGDGTFGPPVKYFMGSNGPIALVAGDFNGDAASDLAIVWHDSNGVSVLLGNRSACISSISPDLGIIAGNQTVIINGTNLSDARSVTFGGAMAAITANTATSITVRTPAHPDGVVDVVVTTSSSATTMVRGYRYVVAGRRRAI